MSPVARRAVRALRDLGLNVLGFGLVFAVVVVAAGATLFGLVRKKDLVNPEGKVLPLSAAGFLLGTASTCFPVWTSPARSAGRARSSSRAEPAGRCSGCSGWR